jgi:hypothetical protein
MSILRRFGFISRLGPASAVAWIAPLVLAILATKPLHGADELSNDDRELLKMASSIHFQNRQLVTPDRAEKHADLLVRDFFLPPSDGRSRIATFVLLEDVLIGKMTKQSAERATMHDKMGAIWTTAAIEGAIKGLHDDSIITFKEAHESLAGQMGDAWVDQLQKQEVGKLQARILALHTWSDTAEAVENFARKTLPQNDLSGRNWFAYSADWGPNMAFKFNGRYTFIPGWYVKLTYRGTDPLTDVILANYLKTTGPSTTLTDGQRKALGFNAVAGGLMGVDDKEEQTEKIFRVQNYYDRMPKAGCVFIPKLQKGDVVELPLGEADDDVVTGASVSLICAQGQLPAKLLALTPAMHAGAKKARDEITIGMPKAEVAKRLGDLVPLALEDWPLPTKPSFSSLPEDTEYYRWLDRLPCLVIGFSQEKVVRVELLQRPEFSTLAKQAKPGMSKKELIETFSRQDWHATQATLDDLPPAAKPLLRGVPDDTELYVWGPSGIEPACPMLIVGFSEDKAVKIALLNPKKPPAPKPTVPAKKNRKRR